MARWSIDDIPDQSGRVALITGANSGLGLHSATALARKGATVVMACRSLDRAEAARRQVLDAAPEATVELLQADMSDLASVAAMADAFSQGHARLDILMHNAGVAAPPLTRTAAGHELQFATNTLAPFALTGHLLPRLQATAGSRVVNVASLAHTFGDLDIDDLDWQRRRYTEWPAYGATKLALLLFTYELQRRLVAAGLPTASVAAHPGYAITNLPASGGMKLTRSWLGRKALALGDLLLAQPGEQGALCQLYAATATDVQGGDYIGPDGFKELKGFPRKVTSRPATHNRALARQLWDRLGTLSGVHYLEG